MHFMKLTNLNTGKPVFLNPTNIDAVEEPGDSAKPYSCVFMNGTARPFMVTEDFRTIERKAIQSRKAEVAEIAELFGMDVAKELVKEQVL